MLCTSPPLHLTPNPSPAWERGDLTPDPSPAWEGWGRRGREGLVLLSPALKGGAMDNYIH